VRQSSQEFVINFDFNSTGWPSGKVPQNEIATSFGKSRDISWLRYCCLRSKHRSLLRRGRSQPGQMGGGSISRCKLPQYGMKKDNLYQSETKSRFDTSTFLPCDYSQFDRIEDEQIKSGLPLAFVSPWEH
jgi:hypothetical protein